MPEFKSNTEFERWLNTQPQDVCVAIATRAALRVFPIVAHGTSEQLAFLTARAILTSGVATYSPTPEVRSAARAAADAARADAALAAADAARAAADAAVHAAEAAAEVAVHPADAANSARAAAHFAAPAAADAARAAYSDTDFSLADMPHAPLWNHPREPDWLVEALEAQRNILENIPKWNFWRRWYDGFVIGRPLNWELQCRVALIPIDEWEKGPDRIAEIIAGLEIEFKMSRHAAESKSDLVSSETARAVAGRMAANRDGITLISAGLMDQIADFREVLRGDNRMDAETKDRHLAFLDDLAGKLRMLLELLPEQAAEIGEDSGEEGALWLVEFRSAFFENAREYTSPDNVAGAMIPTGIILGCTALGSFLGMPVAGTVVGGLITGQLKPGKAADDLLNPKSGDE